MEFKDNFDNEDFLNLDDFLNDVEDKKENIYISDSRKAVELISKIINNKFGCDISKVVDDIEYLFAEIANDAIPNKLEYYKKFRKICNQLIIYNKIKLLKGKSIVGFGGQYSAGKTQFINSITKSNIDLPVDLKPTTSIPTYIIKSDVDKITANSVYGYSTVLKDESIMGAITHEFYNKYKIGFTDFLDSIIVEFKEVDLSNKIALLDTPGYTKFDEEKNTKISISDRKKALEKLRLADYLIWLIDVSSCAEITNGDIEFLKELDFKTPILFVFSKADLVTEETLNAAVTKAKETLKNYNIDYFAVTAYSAIENKEYIGINIASFLNYIDKNNKNDNDIIQNLYSLEKDMRSAIEKEMLRCREEAEEIFKHIKYSDEVMEIKSLAELWGEFNQKGYHYMKILNKFDYQINRINRNLKNI